MIKTRRIDTETTLTAVSALVRAVEARGGSENPVV